MKLYHSKVLSFDIKRRTFEGKNGSSLTSKYMPSYKYWLRYKVITLRCTMQNNNDNMTIEECRKLFGCNKDGVKCANCPCLKIVE